MSADHLRSRKKSEKTPFPSFWRKMEYRIVKQLQNIWSLFFNGVAACHGFIAMDQEVNPGGRGSVRLETAIRDAGL